MRHGVGAGNARPDAASTEGTDRARSRAAQRQRSGSGSDHNEDRMT
jgi:hypothetical protein